MTLLDQFSNQLQMLNAELNKLQEELDRNTAKREDLKAFVRTYNELSEKKRVLRREIKEKRQTLTTITDFIEASTGEKTFAMFPLFAEPNNQQQPVTAN